MSAAASNDNRLFVDCEELCNAGLLQGKFAGYKPRHTLHHAENQRHCPLFRFVLNSLTGYVRWPDGTLSDGPRAQINKHQMLEL